MKTAKELRAKLEDNLNQSGLIQKIEQALEDAVNNKKSRAYITLAKQGQFTAEIRKLLTDLGYEYEYLTDSTRIAITY